MVAGVAAGHPSTAAAGLRILASGGNAADAAVCAALASCVAETILTGLGGGGFATYYDATTMRTTCLDFFCAVPGLGQGQSQGQGQGPTSSMAPIEVRFGCVPLYFSIGPATVAVPGVPIGLWQLHRRWGRMPWREVLAPAVELAHQGVPIPATHADTLSSIAEAMLPNQGTSIYAPSGKLLASGDLLHHPGLADALMCLAAEGPTAFYTGPLAASMVDAVGGGPGHLSSADLAAYEVRRSATDTVEIEGFTVHGRRDLSRTIAVLGSLSTSLAKLPWDERAVTVADALLAQDHPSHGSTTNVSVIDTSGNACVVTTTLGVGSGCWIPGTGIHLNSMLGEAELTSTSLAPGDRMPSNMCPMIVTDDTGRAVMALGAAGASRIRTALIHTLVGVLIDDLTVEQAITSPRLHPVSGTRGAPPMVHAEPGCGEGTIAALVNAGYAVSRWDHRSYYFGAVSAIGIAGAAGDPRRDGVGLVLG